MDKIELYYDHYKETFNLSKEAQKRRNKSFVGLCILEAISFWVLLKPEQVFEIFLATINSELDTVLTVGNSILQTLLWLLIVYVLIRYCQDVLYVERQYTYLDKLEREISNCMNGSPFNREGENYLGDYPMVLNFIDLFYKLIAPVMFIMINSVRIYTEWRTTERISYALICDTILYIAIFVIAWFYFFEIHSKITAWCKHHIPFIDKIAHVLRRLLKEV